VIAERVNFDRKTVEKAVHHFADYAGLTLPTLATSLATQPGKHGKSREFLGSVDPL
jgi:hypothetical protein